MVVAHASSKLPGTKDFDNYKSGQWSKQYLSCSLLSNREFNTFDNIKTVFVTEVNEDNYIASSYDDSVTSETSFLQFETLKAIEDNEKIHYVKVGYIHDIYKSVTAISTPDLIEKLSVEREIEQNGEMFNCKNSLTNEVVLDRTATKVTGALLISNGCDLLIEEYLFFKNNNINFKCINKGLYKEKNNLTPYNEQEYAKFIQKLTVLEQRINSNNLDSEILLSYYEDVILQMNYNQEIVDMIKEIFSKYIDISIIETR